MADVNIAEANGGVAVGRTRCGAAITAVGAALPSRVVTSAEVAEQLGLDEKWIVKRTGVRERRWAQPHESMADLAELAARDALARGDVRPRTSISYSSPPRATTRCLPAARRFSRAVLAPTTQGPRTFTRRVLER